MASLLLHPCYDNALISNIFLLGNYQQTLDDAIVAVQLQPTFIKAIENGKFFLSVSVTNASVFNKVT